MTHRVQSWGAEQPQNPRQNQKSQNCITSAWEGEEVRGRCNATSHSSLAAMMVSQHNEIHRVYIVVTADSLLYTLTRQWPLYKEAAVAMH